MSESLNVDQRVKLQLGELVVQTVCMAKEIEDLRAKVAELSPPEAVSADGPKPA